MKAGIDTDQCTDIMAEHLESFKPDIRMVIEGKANQVLHIKLGGEARKPQKVLKTSSRFFQGPTQSKIKIRLFS